MRLTNIFEQLLIENLLDTFVEKNVGDNKPISNEIYEEIKRASKGKVNYILWLAKSYANQILDFTEIIKFGDQTNTIGYFTIFEKNKNKYPYKDINQYKTTEDVEKFMNISIDIRKKDIDLSKSTEISDNYVSIKDIKRLQEVGIDYMGMSQGYQVFRIPNEAKNNYKAFNRYNEILGKCAGREQGAKIDICTFEIGQFKRYLNEYFGSSYFLLYNLSNPDSPYQIHIASRQFKDKNDKQIVEYEKWIDTFDYIEKKTNYESGSFLYQIYNVQPIKDYMFDAYYKETGEVADEGKVINGKLQGVWINPNDEYLELIKYENGIKNGPFLSFYEFKPNGSSKLNSKGYLKDGKFDGEYIKYYRNGGVEFINTYKNGAADGKYISFYVNGDIFSEKWYKMGILYGIEKHFSIDGEIEREIEWKNGKMNGVLKNYKEDGKLRGYSTYKDDMLDGLYISYYDNGNLRNEMMYKNGQLHGKENEYYQDGTLKSSKNYINGILDGEFKTFLPNGQLRQHMIFDNGKPIKGIHNNNKL